MARYFASFLFIFAILVAFNPSTVTLAQDEDGPPKINLKNLKLNPNILGIKAKCEACRSLAEAYNETKDAADRLANWIDNISRETNVNDWSDYQHHKKDAPEDTGERMSKEDIQNASNEMNYRLMLDEMKDRLPELKEQLKRLDELAKDFLAQLRECEATMCVREETKPDLGQMMGTGKMTVALPFDWRGPDPPVCHKCAKLAEHLNALPALARAAMTKLEQARAEKMIAEMELIELRGEHSAVPGHKTRLSGGPVMSEREVRDSMKDAEERKEKAEKDIKEAQQEVDELKKNFEQTLKLYNDCVPTCPKQKENKKVGMVFPSGDGETQHCGFTPQEPIIIGPNSEYGTGAQVKDKAKDMAKGLLGSAIGSIGGGGISLGGKGGGEDGGSDGPKTYRDPLKKIDFTRLSSGGLDLGIRAGFTDDGFTVSQKIYDAPGDGTFHALWLEDAKGRKMLPGKYYIYGLYVDHKLTVWWTYDHWTNGVHDDHDEGRETQEWRQNLGNLAVRFGGNEGIKNSIWYQSGFNTAVKGVQEMGAEFPGVTPEDLATQCGLTMVSHITAPERDPVSTIPVLGRLFIDPQASAGKKEKDLLVYITPTLAANYEGASEDGYAGGGDGTADTPPSETVKNIKERQKAEEETRLGREGYRAYKSGNARGNQ
ncbi:MAG: hypothetical protein IT558_01100 [Alphaproteobacteria bacterium]|nr:hypothetical protein [Alphaproteobacteria bacterium]